MIIHSPFTRVDNGFLRIPSSNRTPLYITERTTVYASMYQGSDLFFPEMLVTTFLPELWGYLWRIEMDVIDETGIVERLFSWLYQQKIYVIVSETTTIESGEYHTISMIVNCKDYSSSIDLGSESRMKKGVTDLPGLDLELSTEYIHELIFHDFISPRLRIKRIWATYRCHSGVLKLTHSVPSMLMYSDGNIELSEEIINIIKTQLDTTDNIFHAGILTDSKDRIMRVVYSGLNSGLVHFKVWFRVYDDIVSKILYTVRSERFDVVRCRYRQGVYNPPASLNDFELPKYGTLDLVLRYLDSGKIADHVLLKQLNNAFQSTVTLRGFRVQVEIGELYPEEVGHGK